MIGSQSHITIFIQLSESDMFVPGRLRVHPTQEWHDLYQPEYVVDLERFFNCYLKNASYGWEKTPRVRCSLLGFNKVCISEYYFIFDSLANRVASRIL